MNLSMDEKDVEGGIDNTVDFLGVAWNDILFPIIQGIGALIEMLPPVATGIIAGVLLAVYFWRRARSG